MVLASTIGVGVSVAAALLSKRAADLSIEATFLVAAKNRVAAIRRQVEANVQAVQSIVAFYGASQLVERDEFQQFAAAVQANQPALESLIWAPHIRRQDREGFERGTLTVDQMLTPIMERDAQGQFVKAGDRGEYVPVHFEVIRSERSLLGFDLLSDPIRREAITQAFATGRMVLSKPMNLLNKPRETPGFLLIHPIYPMVSREGDALPPIVDPIGFVAGVVESATLLSQAMAYLEPEAIDTWLSDVEPDMRSSASQSPIEDGNEPDDAATDLAGRDSHLAFPHFEEQLNVAGRRLTVVCTAQPAFAAMRRSWESIVILLVGLTITFLLARFLVISNLRSRQYEVLAKERGTKLDLRERELKQVAFELQLSDAELNLARRVQTSLLPANPPEVPGIDLAAVSLPAYKVSGDHYDFFPVLPNHLGIVVGDASGHGLAAAMLMVELHTCLRTVTCNHRPIGEVVEAVNRVLSVNMLEDRFITLLLASLDTTRKEFVYANAGHPPGFVIDGGGKVKHVLASAAMPIGIDVDTAFPSSAIVSLAPGDILFLMTDGVMDAMSPEGEFFGLERAIEVVKRLRCEPAQFIVQALCEKMRTFCSGHPPHDDVTIVVAKVTDDPGFRVIPLAS
ncbi:MAG: SpoIIE family protein phosphatase [Phycisphaeraceae bacterium]